MFWKKKIEEKISNRDDIFWNDAKPKYRPFYGSYELVTKEDYNQLDQKLNLILDHLNLEYVPETEKKEPAKLAEKKTPDEKLARYAMELIGIDLGTLPKKKKRGRPKKK